MRCGAIGGQTSERGGVGFLVVSAVTAWSRSSSIPATPFLNSVTLLPSDRITLGRRLPKRSSITPPTMAISIGPRVPKMANGNGGSMGPAPEEGRRRQIRSAQVSSVRNRGGGDDDRPGHDPGGQGRRG